MLLGRAPVLAAASRPEHDDDILTFAPATAVVLGKALTEQTLVDLPTNEHAFADRVGNTVGQAKGTFGLTTMNISRY